MFEKIEIYLSTNAEYAWLIVIFFAFLESFILSGLIVSSAVLFSICIFVYNTELMPVTAIVPVAVLGAILVICLDLFLVKLLALILCPQRLFKKDRKLSIERKSF